MSDQMRALAWVSDNDEIQIELEDPTGTKLSHALCITNSSQAIYDLLEVLVMAHNCDDSEPFSLGENFRWMELVDE